MSLLRNVLTYMGLGPDEDYDYDDGYLYGSATAERGHEPERASGRHRRVDDGRRRGGFDDDDDARSAPPVAREGRRHAGPPPPDDDLDLDLDPEPGFDDDAGHGRHSPHRRGRSQNPDRRSSRPLRAVPASDLDRNDDGVRVRQLPPPPTSGARVGPPTVAKPRPLTPRSFADAKILADEFKRSVPVIMNLQGVDRDLARRLIDFASGVCYSLDGSMEKIASQVFLLTPQSVEVSDEDRRRFER